MSKPSMRQKAAAFDALQTIYRGDLYEQVIAICREQVAATKSAESATAAPNASTPDVGEIKPAK